MMKFKWDKKYFYWGVTIFSVVLFSILVFIAAFNHKATYAFFHKMLGILSPFIMGLVFAYVLCPILNFTERKIFLPFFQKTKVKHVKRVSRVFSIISAMLFAILLIVFLFWLIIPQIVESVIGIINNFQLYYNNFTAWLSSIMADMPVVRDYLAEEFKDFGSTLSLWAKSSIIPQANTILLGVTSGVIDIFNIVKNLFVGIIVTVYILYSKERFSAQIKKIMYSLFSVSSVNHSIEITRRSHKIFSGFINGKIIDSVIIGILCFIGMTIFNMPFALLISVVIGVTNVIPFFGPFIGGIPCAFLILLVDPVYCLYFCLFILALQQLDGNVIGPKILGDSTGLSPIWVIFSILVGGGLFGFMGMIIGVPTFAVIYSLVSDFVSTRLAKRNLPTSTGAYYKLSSVEQIEKAPLYKDDTAPSPIAPQPDDK